MINRIFIFVVISILFTACVDVNLKSELPKIDYYKLDTSSLDTKKCEAYNLIAFVGIDIPREYQNNKIFYREDSKIRYFIGTSFLRNINQSFETMIIKEFDNKCLKIVLPPFSGIELESFLNLKLLDFEIIKQGEDAKAFVSIFYQITSRGNIWQSGIVSASKDLDTFNQENSIKALQEASKEVITSLGNKIIPK